MAHAQRALSLRTLSPSSQSGEPVEADVRHRRARRRHAFRHRCAADRPLGGLGPGSRRRNRRDDTGMGTRAVFAVSDRDRGRGGRAARCACRASQHSIVHSDSRRAAHVAWGHPLPQQRRDDSGPSSGLPATRRRADHAGVGNRARCGGDRRGHLADDSARARAATLRFADVEHGVDRDAYRRPVSSRCSSI